MKLKEIRQKLKEFHNKEIVPLVKELKKIDIAIGNAQNKSDEYVEKVDKFGNKEYELKCKVENILGKFEKKYKVKINYSTRMVNLKHKHLKLKFDKLKKIINHCGRNYKLMEDK